MATWQEVNRQILDAIDLEAEYKAMGLEITGGPSANGYAPCKVFGGNERSASAGVNLTGEHPLRGRYKSFTGECANLSFFEFCAMAGRFADWKEARDFYRKAAGIKSPAKNAKKPVSDRLAVRDYNAALVRSWASHKPPIAEWAVRIAGGRIAGYPPTSQKFTCIVIPVFGAHGVEDDPCGWVGYNKSGRDLPVSQGKGKPVQMVKIKTIEGSIAGWMNHYALANLEQAEVVWKVEGPADMLALQSIFPKDLLGTHLVLTNSSGTLGVLPDDHLDLLAGKTVYVVHDADKDGQAGGEKWSEALSYTAQEVRHVRLPYEVDEKHGKDLRDWINEGHDYHELLTLAETAPIIAKPTETTEAGETVKQEKDQLARDRLICQTLRLDVLGELPDRSIKIFSEFHGKASVIENVNRLTRTDLIQICGPFARDYVFEGNGLEASPNQFHIIHVREAIAMLAGHESAGEDVECGQGIWQGKGEHSNHLVLVGPGEAIVVDSEFRTEKACKPRLAGLKVDLDAPKDVRWFNAKQFNEYLELAANTEWCVKQIDAACKLFDKWYWRSSPETCSTLMVGLVMASWIQSIWSWRPMVSITAGSDSGKSCLFELLESLFGQLAFLSAKSTEAGIRQRVDNHSRVILCDEFESDRHRKAILEFIRTGSRGNKTYRGTSGGNGSARGYGLRHICWVTAVEVGLARAPDRNRFIQLEIGAPPKHLRGKLSLPPEPEIRDLGQRLMVVAVRHAIAANELAGRLKANSFEGVHGRVVESFATPMSLLACAVGLDEQGAIDLMARYFSELEQDPSQATKDETDLLGDILSSTVSLGHGEEAAVGQILTNSNSYSGGLESIERAGVMIAYDSRHTQPKRLGLFLAHKAILRYLLKGTQWADQAIDQLLKRLPTAQKRQYACGGHRPWGIMLDWSWFEERYGDQDEAGSEREF